ncbi:hypothetical protein pb186bvf_008622 [Paramecium bursaria]
MSIFHTSNISEKPQSYTRDPINHDINYQAIKSSVRSNIIDKYSSFEKLGRQSPSLNRGQKDSQKESPARFKSALKSIEMIFGKHQGPGDIASTQSPAKFSGLKKKMQSIGLQESDGFQIQSAKGFKQQYYEQSPTFLSPQQRVITLENNKTARTGSFTQKFSSQNKLSASLPITKLVELGNLLDLTPNNDLLLLPRNYIDELQRIGTAIQRNLKTHLQLKIKQYKQKFLSDYF